MATYDILVLIVLATTTCLGALKGFAWQVASLTALCASYLVAFKFRAVVGQWLPIAAPMNTLVAMLVLYASCSLTIWYVFRQIHKLIDRVKLKDFDKQMGAFFGLLKGAAICFVVTLFAIALLGERVGAAILDSHAGRWMARGADQLQAVLPEELDEVVGPLLERVDDRLEQGRIGRGQHGLSKATSSKPRLIKPWYAASSSKPRHGTRPLIPPGTAWKRSETAGKTPG
jgi:membrane protein required for colicin V production